MRTEASSIPSWESVTFNALCSRFTCVHLWWSLVIAWTSQIRVWYGEETQLNNNTHLEFLRDCWSWIRTLTDLHSGSQQDVPALVGGHLCVSRLSVIPDLGYDTATVEYVHLTEQKQKNETKPLVYASVYRPSLCYNETTLNVLKKLK